MSTTDRSDYLMRRHAWLDPMTGVSHVIVVEPTKPTFDAVTIEHQGCDQPADVAMDLDCAYCSTCGWQARISGAWLYDLFLAAGRARS